jgi:hypothetical protein
VSVKPGAELLSSNERSVSGFSESANTAAAGNIVAVTIAATAASGVPRLRIDLSVYIFVSLPFCFYVSTLFVRDISAYYHEQDSKCNKFSTTFLIIP